MPESASGTCLGGGSTHGVGEEYDVAIRLGKLGVLGAAVVGLSSPAAVCGDEGISGRGLRCAAALTVAGDDQGRARGDDLGLVYEHADVVGVGAEVGDLVERGRGD